MARGEHGGQTSTSGLLGGLSPQIEEKLSGNRKPCLMFTVACVLSSIFALSALSIITNSCEERISASTFRSASMERMAQNYRMHSFYSSEDHSPSKKRKIDSEEIVIDDVFKKSYNTNLKNIVFGIAASSKLWQSRKYYVREWWQKRTMRGYVWLETPINGTWDEFAPPFKISANTSQFKYSRPKGNRAALRLTRIVTETFKLGLKNVDWFVMGDDDTIIFTDNLVRMLSNYDPKQMHYIGSHSESHVQNTRFSYSMAYGGGGFAISYPLARALATTQDGCLNRYPELFGSDDRVHACITELGVPITKNQGFHQFDIRGNPMGLLAAHPMTPVLSIHHLDIIGSLFPRKSRLVALRLLMRAARVEQASMFQQTITYAQQRRYSFSISSGYVVRVYQGFVAPWELEEAPRTFYSWYGSKNHDHFPFDVREIPDDPCEKPTLFFLSKRFLNNTASGCIETVYLKHRLSESNSNGCDERINSVERIRVRSTPLDHSWFMPRRLCGRVETWKNDTIDIFVRPCQQGELVVGVH